MYYTIYVNWVCEIFCLNVCLRQVWKNYTGAPVHPWPAPSVQRHPPVQHCVHTAPPNLCYCCCAASGWWAYWKTGTLCRLPDSTGKCAGVVLWKYLKYCDRPIFVYLFVVVVGPLFQLPYKSTLKTFQQNQKRNIYMVCVCFFIIGIVLKQNKKDWNLYIVKSLKFSDFLQCSHILHCHTKPQDQQRKS